MNRLKRTGAAVAVVASLTSALLFMTAGSASAALFTAQADVLFSGWGDNPALVSNASYTTILVNRGFESTSGLGRRMFVELEINTVSCEVATDDLVTVNQGNGGAFVGLPSDLTLTTTSADYSGKLQLVEHRSVRHHCAAPGPPTFSMRDLGTVQVTADWTIGKRSLVKLCEYYATPPPPAISLIAGWRSTDAPPTMTVAGAVTASFLPATRYSSLVQSTFTLGGMPAPAVRPAACVVA